MELKVCEERHKRLEEKINVHDIRLNDHGKRIDKIEQNQSKIDTKIENLCDQLKQLVSVLKWYIGLSVGALVSFFFYAIQHNIFK
ncbi:hemolysin XhlA family protein [Clostridium botulinum]|uniref:Hemolysin XhlA family protein n=1 Tax=Clostridium botulinum TaxID=1491 RepID=A0ABD7CIS0_CLOBO|nr:hemolysin XhlA family protein [Clostridium botulinum]KGO14031.1 membrane protein [Clostridium botulinum]KIN82711.1 membrane protein [Clostridium botulinum]QRI52966.1 hemolysin XhlA family protein [Clostridium botulinum]